jgi:predicted secreted protein
MSTLLDLEAPDASGLRDPLVDSFNAGFQAYGLGAATCPTDRGAQEAKLAKDGFRLAKQMAGLYRPITAPPETQPKQTAPQKAD